MAGKDTAYMKTFLKLMELTEEAELPKQTRFTQRKILTKDIDMLVEENGFVEVSKKTMIKIFKMDKLKAKAKWYNIKSVFLTVTGHFQTSIYFWMMAGFAAWFPHYTEFFLPTVINVVCFIVAAAFFIVGIIYFFEKLKRVNTELSKIQTVDIDLKKDQVKDVEIELPQGAIEKYIVAQKTKVFEKFFIHYPRLNTENLKFNFPTKDLDPVITGMTIDRREFMIVWWDLKKDENKAETRIEYLKKFKIES